MSSEEKGVKKQDYIGLLLYAIIFGYQKAVDSVLSLFAKSVDVKPEETIMLAIPRLRVDAKQLLPVYKINLVEAKTMEEAIKMPSSMIKSM
jgi:hypothetical protein